MEFVLYSQNYEQLEKEYKNIDKFVPQYCNKFTVHLYINVYVLYSVYVV